MEAVIIPEDLLDSLPITLIGSWEKLQQFSADLLIAKEDTIDSRVYLTGGAKQDGIDVYATVRDDGRYIVVQCKRIEDLRPAKIKTLFDEFLNESFVSKTSKFYLCTTGSLNKKNQEAEIEEGRRRLSEKKIDLVIWDYEGINRELRINPHPALVARYFTTEIAQRFYGTIYTDYLKRWRKVAKHSYPKPENYIVRKLIPHSDYYKNNDELYLFREEKRSKLPLYEIVQKNNDEKGNRTIVLSIGGFGKTIELQNLAAEFSKEEEKLFPILHSLIDYSGQSISEILSLHDIDWKGIPEEAMLLILDGFDEIKTEYVEEFIKQLNMFGDSKPKAHIVVSSRFNFYDVSNRALRGFNIFILDEFSSDDVEDYLALRIQGEESLFQSQLRKSNLTEYIRNPYYLVRLVYLFESEQASFPNTRSEFFERILFMRIDDEIRKYGVKEDKKQLLVSVQKVAFCMTVSGNSALTENDLAKIIPEELDRNKLHRYFLMNKHAEKTNSWSFEHKNLQEYLCASCLLQMSFDVLIQTITFKLDFKKVQPKFINTLSFFFSLLDNDNPTMQQLFSWLLENEPDVLMRFEKSRISEETRLEILQAIFRYYKSRGLFFYSSVLRVYEIADLIDINGSVITYLEKELQDVSTSDRLCYDIIELLEGCQRPWAYRDQLESTCYNIIERSNRSVWVKADAIDALRHFGFLEEENLQRILKAPIDLTAFSLRHPIVHFLSGRDYSSRYMDFLLASVPIFIDGQRDSLGMAGESLVSALVKAIDVSNIKLLLQFIANNIKHLNYHHHSDRFRINIKDFRIILEKASQFYSQEPTVLGLGYKIFRSLEYVTSDKDWFPLFQSFFQRTCGNRVLFKKLERYSSRSKDAAYFADKQLCEELIDDYKAGRISNEEMRLWRNFMPREDMTHSWFYDRLKQEFGSTFLYNDDGIDYSAIRIEYESKNQEMLLDKKMFLNDVKKIFAIAGKTTMIMDDLFNHKNPLLQAHHYSFAYEMIRRQISKEKSQTFDQIAHLFESESNWKWFQIKRIKALLEKDKAKVSTALVQLASEWCLAKIEELNFENGITEDSKFRIHLNSEIYFVEQLYLLLDIDLEDRLLLKMLPAAFNLNGFEEEGTALSNVIIKNTKNKKELKNQIISNIKSGKYSLYVLETHFAISAALGFTECLPNLFSTISSYRGTSNYQLNKLTDFYLKLGGNILDFKQFVKDPEPSDSQDNVLVEWNWYLINKLVEHDPKLIGRMMLNIINNPAQPEQNKNEASRILFQLGDINGLIYWRDYILSNKKLLFDYHNSPTIYYSARIPELEAITVLIEMLETVYTTSLHLVLGKFDSVEEAIYNSLNAVAISNEERFTTTIAQLSKLYLAHYHSDYASTIAYKIESIKQNYFKYGEFDLTIASAINLYNTLTLKL